MDKLATYRSAVQRLIANHCDDDAVDAAVRSEQILDREHDHYQLVNVGWQDDRRVYGCILHLDIIGEKVWVQYNGTEFDIANELVALGVAKQDIVLGFQSPFKRQFTEFAVC